MMTDLDERIRRLLDPAAPVTIEEIKSRPVPRFVASPGRRVRRPVVAVALAFAVLATVIAVSTSHHPRGTTVAVVEPTTLPAGDRSIAGPVSSRLTRNGVTVTLTLDHGTVSAGTPIHGTLVVTNRTRSAIGAGDTCPADVYRAGLAVVGQMVEGAWEQPACTPGFAFHPGTVRLPVSIATTSGARVAPLTAGRYLAEVVFNRFAVPVPPPIPVTVTVVQPYTLGPASEGAYGDRAQHGIHVEVHLDVTAVPAGSTIRGEVVIHNFRSTTMSVTDVCTDQVFQVLLTPPGATASPVLPPAHRLCSSGFRIGPGSNRYPVSIAVPKRPGSYDAAISFLGPLRLPVPLPVTVTVTPPGTGTGTLDGYVQPCAGPSGHAPATELVRLVVTGPSGDRYDRSIRRPWRFSLQVPPGPYRVGEAGEAPASEVASVSAGRTTTVSVGNDCG